MKYILNTPILTDYGTFIFYKVSLEEAKSFVKDSVISAVGHESTARLLTELLEAPTPIEANRIAIRMEVNDEALVCKLTVRLKEGEVMDYLRLKKMYEDGLIELGILRRVA